MTTKKTNDKADKGITPRQVRVLAALASAKKPMTTKALCEAAGIDPTAIGCCGYTDPEVNKRPVHAGNLLNRGYVSLAESDGSNGSPKGSSLWTITAEGRTALKAAAKEAIAKDKAKDK